MDTKVVGGSLEDLNSDLKVDSPQELRTPGRVSERRGKGKSRRGRLLKFKRVDDEDKSWQSELIERVDRMAVPTPPPVQQVSIIQGDRIARFCGRRRESDYNFNDGGPSIELYIRSIETFCQANQLTEDSRKN